MEIGNFFKSGGQPLKGPFPVFQSYFLHQLGQRLTNIIHLFLAHVWEHRQ